MTAVAMPSHQRKESTVYSHWPDSQNTVGEPENAMKCRKALLSEEEL